jgi:heme-degrading monooxygenase HmoA
MIAREWKAICPMDHKDGFIKYLYKTGVKDTSSIKGFKDAQIFSRELDDMVEITLITFWDCLESIKAYAGDDIEVARLYPEDHIYKLEPDSFVIHYDVVK